MHGNELKKLGRVGLALVLLIVSACDPSELLGPDAAQGIDGIALLGPRCPVQSEQNPCPDTPYDARITIRTASGDFITRIRTGEDGRFRVGLAPGGYVLEPEEGDPFPAATAQDVEVTEGHYTEVVVSFDTGIR